MASIGGLPRKGTTVFGVDKDKKIMPHWEYMKKRAAKRTIRRTHSHAPHASENYLVVVRGWMFVVAFALMLGVGAIVGQVVAQQLSGEGVVAGVQIER